MSSSVLVLVVTFNRLNDLKVCVSSIRNQSYRDFDVLIVNNGSSDGTKDWLNTQPDLLVIHQDNVGGAGGFYQGMKYMMDHDYQWLLMMDDDGIADKEELKNLIESYDDVRNASGSDVILNALVVDKDNHSKTSFLWARGSNRSRNIAELREIPFFKDVHPFNGTLIKRDIIERIGMIKREMFIWGDEKEYMARAIHNGIGLFTVTSAIHYHPKEKGQKGNILPFVSKFQILLKPHKMSHYYYRNEGFIYYTYPERRKKMLYFYGAYIIRFLTHGEYRELVKFIRYFRRGAMNNFE